MCFELSLYNRDASFVSESRRLGLNYPSAFFGLSWVHGNDWLLELEMSYRTDLWYALSLPSREAGKTIRGFPFSMFTIRVPRCKIQSELFIILWCCILYWSLYCYSTGCIDAVMAGGWRLSTKSYIFTGGSFASSMLTDPAWKTCDWGRRRNLSCLLSERTCEFMTNNLELLF